MNNNLLNIKSINKKKITDDISQTTQKTKRSYIKKKIITQIKEEIPVEILCNDTNEIKKIYHMSDIHIKRDFNDEKEKEYITVFERLYETMRKDNKNCLIVITGDIIDEYSSMTSGEIILLKNMFIELSNICPIICILGNHDVNKNNTRTDNITANLMGVETKNKIHILLENKNYYYNNIIFGLTTMNSTTITQCNDTNKIRIGLYHGIVKSDIVPFFIGENYKFEVNDFKKYYDITLLGDIHKHCYLDKEKTVVYAGSLIQQTCGEDLNTHGIVKWDLVKNKSEFIKIKNDYGIIKASIDENGLKILAEDKDIPLYPLFKIGYKNIPYMSAEIIANEIKIKYINAKYSLTRTDFDGLNLTIGKNNKDELKFIKSDKDVLDLINKYVVSDEKYSESEKNDITNEITEILKEINYQYCGDIKKFTLNKLDVDNFFVYGTDNSINYTKMNGIIGISGNSATGKTTISTDALYYAIFGITLRGSGFNIINIKSREAKTCVEFVIETSEKKTYSIERSRKINNKKKDNNTTETVIIKENGRTIMNITDINRYIANLVCEPELFLQSTMILQNDGSHSFINMNNVDRKKFIIDILKLDVFNKILDKIKEKDKIIKLKFDDCKNNLTLDKNITDFDRNKKLNNIISRITEQQKLITEKQNNYDDIIKNIDTTTFDITENDMIKLKEYTNLITDKELYKNSKNLDTNITLLSSTISEFNKNKAELIKQNKTKNKEYDEKHNKIITQYKNCEEKHKVFEENKKQKIEEIQENINTLNMSLRNSDNEIIFNRGEYVKLKNKYEEQSKICKEIENKIIDVNETEEIINGYAKYNDANKLVKQYIENKKYLEKKIINISKQLKELENHEYDPKCKFCIKSEVTKSKLRAENEKEMLEKEKIENEKNINENNLIIENNKKLNEKYIDIQKLKETNIEIKNKHSLLVVELLNIKLEITKLENNKILFELNEENKKKNTLIIKQKKILEKNMDSAKNNIDKEYENYVKLKTEIDIIKLEINNNEKAITDIDNKIQSKDEEKNLLEKHYRKYFDLIIDEKKYVKLNEKIICQADEKKKMYKYSIEINNEIERFKNDILNLEKEKLNIENLILEYEKYENNLVLLRKLKIDLDSNTGIISKILGNVVSSMSDAINIMLNNITKFKIYMTIEGKQLDISKNVNESDKKISIDTISGGERFVIDIAFKLMLDKYTNNIKTNFIVIDELFNCLDNESLIKVATIFNYIKTQYKFAIIISHNDEIKKLYDTNITVIHNDGFSKVNF